MNNFLIPLGKQELLHHMLQTGGVALCPLQRPESTIHARLEVELTDQAVVISVELGGHSGELTLKRSDRANHLHLRDFIQDIANGRIESAQPAPGSTMDQELPRSAADDFEQEQPSRDTQIARLLDESQALLNSVRTLLAA
ncbi:hypothetical protein [Pseudomonas alvandae]|uniref:hypothetical protein n=1 Tax=Pseudomonas canavaninivorans TaxID=2842348 RepID=UPI00215EBC73|nr:hypothetical protein [Pseudomonas canavaninivorans]UVM74906.1 hypothetical protein LOY40_12375 [Pseudomonas canavaninivorans]